MALLFCERMDYYTTKTHIADYNQQNGNNWAVVYDNVFFDWLFPQSSGGPFNERAMRHSTNGKVAVPFGPLNSGNTTVMWAGYVYYFGGATASANAGLQRREVMLSLEVSSGLNAGLHFGVVVTAGANEIQIYNAASAVVARVYGALQPKTWHWVEIKVTCANSGTFEMSVDGFQVASVSGDFLNGSDVNTSYMMWRGMEGDIWYHSVLVADGTGSSFNTSIGHIHTEIQQPDADGAVAAWTASAGSNFQCIDDTIAGAASDSDYISSSTTDQINLASHGAFSLPDLSAIKFVQVNALSRSDTSGDKLALAARSGGVDAAGADQPLVNGTYKYVKGFFETDPNTGAAWTKTNLNNAEFGVKKRV